MLSLDGLDDYGISNDKVSLFTIDQYRKYRKVLVGDSGGWWLITPDSTPSGQSDSCVLYIDTDCCVSYFSCDRDLGVRPFFILQS